MISKAKLAPGFFMNTRFRLALLLTLGLLATAVALLIPISKAASPPVFGPTLLHFHGNPDDSGGSQNAPCAGAPADIQTCGGPFLKPSPTLFAGPAAIWHSTSALDDDVERSNVDPNWIWNLDGSPTTLR